MNVITLSVPKVKSGRPRLHQFTGRHYLLQDEVVKALKDVEWLEVQMQNHDISLARTLELENAKVQINPSTMSFTFCGPIKNVIHEMNATIEQYTNDAKVKSITPRIAKERIVSPKSSLALKSKVSNVMTKNGMAQRKDYEEFSSKRIYGYVEVEFAS